MFFCLEWYYGSVEGFTANKKLSACIAPYTTWVSKEGVGIETFLASPRLQDWHAYLKVTSRDFMCFSFYCTYVLGSGLKHVFDDVIRLPSK